MKSLSAKEQKFVDEYLRDLDPVRAAMEAGYAENTARVKSFGWVSKPEDKPAVYHAILKAKEERSERVKIDSDEVLRHALELSIYDVRGLFDATGEPLPPHQLPERLARVVQGVEKRADGTFHYRLPDRNAATERLIKHLGLYERDNDQSKAQSLIDVLNAISSGKNALDLARERDEARQRSRH